MKLLNVDTIEQAREKIFSYTKSWQLKIKSVSVKEAQGFILAEDILSSCDIPSFRRSTVDGYAVISGDTAAASDAVPVFLKQNGSVSMGKQADFFITSGECAYVPTGGMLPGGTDAVVMIEYCEKENDVIAVNEAAACGAGTAEAGEDFQKGKLLLRKGSLIRPQETGALSAAGVIRINIFVPLSLSLFSTGDELTAPENNPAPGEVRDINTNMLTALAVKNGYNIVSSQLIRDDEDALEAAVRKAAGQSDIVIISGGSSQGEKDFTASVINRIAKPGVFTHGLAVKPGKPTIIGWDENSKTLFAGLPGHPVSAMMIFILLFNRLQEQIINSGIQTAAFQIPVSPFHNSFPVPAKINCNVPGTPGRSVCLPVALELKDGIYIAQPVFGKAGMISALTNAHGFIIIDLNKEGLKKDEPVLVHLF